MAFPKLNVLIDPENLRILLDIYSSNSNQSFVFGPIIDRYENSKGFIKKTPSGGVTTDPIPYDHWKNTYTLICHLDVDNNSLYDGGENSLLRDLEDCAFWQEPRITYAASDDVNLTDPSLAKTITGFDMIESAWTYAYGDEPPVTSSTTELWLIKKLVVTDNHNGSSRIDIIAQTFSDQYTIQTVIES